MVAEVGFAFSGAKLAWEIAKGISALKSETEINRAVVELQRTLLEIQEAAFEDKQAISRLVDEKAALAKQLKDLCDWENEKKRYVLTKSNFGAFFYRLRPKAANGEVAHRLCSTCFLDGTKSFLHTTTAHSGGEEVMCQKCKSQLTISDFGSIIESVRASDDDYGMY